MLATEKMQQVAQSPKQGKWHQTPSGRVVAGLVLGLGLSYGLLLFVTHMVKMDTLAPQAAAIVFLGIQGVALMAGGMLAGAGQTKGILYGAGVGCISGVLAFGCVITGALAGIIEPFSNAALPPLPPLQMTLPVVHILFGALGGLIGIMVWKPLPKLALPASVPAEQKPTLGTKIALPPQGDKKALFPWAGPIAWIRVVIGMVVAVGGAIWALPLLHFLVALGGLDFAEILKVQKDVSQGELLALSVLIGGAIAGATTSNGLKQGVCVGFGAGIGMVGYFMMKGDGTGPEKLLGPLLSSIFLGPLGGWFGSELMPPAPKGRVVKRRGWL
jgi:hypothetical protein